MTKKLDKKISTLSPKSRRDFLFGLGLLGLGMTTSLKAGAAISCGPVTPVQPEGPFYPVRDQLDKNNDLTQVHGLAGKALGQVVYVQGVVRDQNCEPVKGALVEIWQACKSGRYNHPGDTENAAPLDPNFQYWGRATTDAEGRYTFKTIIPGSYPAGGDWIRPPHIHYKVSRLGFAELITQMYFGGEVLNSKDLILRELSSEEQNRVVVQLEAPTEDMETSAQRAQFDIVLRRLR